MGEAAARRLTWSIALRLGRVSNLPTVWTNVLAGLVLGGTHIAGSLYALLGLAFSLLYVAGMYLNDAFDREIDARERPERPIPSGLVAPNTVFGFGFLLLAGGLVLLMMIGFGHPDGTGWRGPLAGAALAGAILVYDAWHKGNPLSPLLMGFCRMLVYIGAAVAASTLLSREVIVAALVSLSYLIGLTYAAKQETLTHIENLWPLGFLAVPIVYALSVAASGFAGLLFAAAFLVWLAHALSFLLGRGKRDVGRAVVSLIAGICLLDAVFIVGAGEPGWAGLAAGAFLLTLALQRRIAGT